MVALAKVHLRKFAIARVALAKLDLPKGAPALGYFTHLFLKLNPTANH
jgi:hypothetical protein